MARSGMVWGIDVGQCALKALRCQQGDDADKIVVVGFDYIEYPKILSQPGSDPNAADRRGAEDVPLAEFGARRPGGDFRFGAERVWRGSSSCRRSRRRKSPTSSAMRPGSKSPST